MRTAASGENRDNHTALLCMLSGCGLLNFTLAIAGWMWMYWIFLFRLQIPLRDLPLKWPLCVIFCLFQLSAFVSALVMSFRGVPGREAVVTGCVAISVLVFLVETTFSVPDMCVDLLDDGREAVLWFNWPCTGGYYMSDRTRYLGATGVVICTAVAVLFSKRRLEAAREAPGQ